MLHPARRAPSPWSTQARWLVDEDDAGHRTLVFEATDGDEDVSFGAWSPRGRYAAADTEADLDYQQALILAQAEARAQEQQHDELDHDQGHHDPGDTAEGTFTIVVDYGMGDLTLDWELQGDVYGGEVEERAQVANPRDDVLRPG